jgi:hypothetical protein
MKKFLSGVIFIASILWVSDSIAQKNESTFNGFFNGINLNVQCRAAQDKLWLECDCFDSISINGVVIKDIMYLGYQIDLANKTELALYDPLEIVIYHQIGCDYRILNPTDFSPKVILPVDTLYAAETSIHWRVSQNYPDLNFWVQLEQFKWDRWVKIGVNHKINTEQVYSADIAEYLHKGSNRIRAVVCNIDGAHVPSDEVVISSKAKKIKAKYKNGQLNFSTETEYIIYNEKQELVDKRKGAMIDFTKMNTPSGKYTVYYSNKVKLIKYKSVH